MTIGEIEMRELKAGNDSRRTKRYFSEQEKRAYCAAWEESALKQLEFCKTHGISCSTLKRWVKEFKDKEHADFVPVMIKEQALLRQEEHISVEIRLPNQLQICMTIQEHRLLLLIQELSHATSIIR